ncbi:hypothetical protein M514_03791, partial [Trichuris suis]
MQDCNLYISTNPTWQRSFFGASLQCIKGVWRDVKSSNGMLLSLIGYLCEFDPKPLYAELRYNPIEVNVEQSIIDQLMREHQAEPYKTCPINFGNMGLLLILLGKRVDQTSYTAWAQARVKCMLDMSSHESKGYYDLKKIMKIDWATNIDLIYRYSLTARANVLEFLLKSRNSYNWCWEIRGYICDFLHYARIKSIFLIQQYLINQWQRPILADPYLSTDMEHWAAAMQAWEKFPPSKRVYAGLIANDDVYHLLAGNQLQRLAYIAVQVGTAVFENPHLKNYKCKAPPDKEACDALVKKYFSPNVQLPEDTISPRFWRTIRASIFGPSQGGEWPSFAKMLLEDIAKAESLLKEEDQVAREQLAKRRFVANLMLQKERLNKRPVSSKLSDDQPSTTSSCIKEEPPEARERSTQREHEKSEEKVAMPTTKSSEPSEEESEAESESEGEAESESEAGSESESEAESQSENGSFKSIR